MKHLSPAASAITCAALVMLAGCAAQKQGPAPQLTVPPETGEADSPVTGPVIAAEVEVRPVQTAELAFLVEGRVKNISVKAGDPVEEGQQLIELEATDAEFAVVSAQAEAVSAELNQRLQRSSRQYKVWNGRKWIWTRGLPELRLKADARVELALGSLDVARSELAQASLTAPFDGTVVQVNLAPGEMARVYTPAIVLADLSRMEVVTTDLSEREIADVHVGQPATVRLKALDAPLAGRVKAIDVMATESEDGDTVFQVTVQLDTQPPGLLWGMTGEVQIDTRP